MFENIIVELTNITYATYLENHSENLILIAYSYTWQL